MANRFLMNLLLTLVWVALYGDFTLLNFIFGFVLSYGIMWLISRGQQDQSYFTRLPKTVWFFFYFLYELVKANLQVAYDVSTPRHYMKPGIVKVPLDAKTDLEITLLANLITLTPGTLSLGVSEDRKALYVHAMYIQSKEDFVDSIKNGFEKKLLEIMR